MQMIIKTKEDLSILNGKFILQLDEEYPNYTLMDFEWNFAKEKRLYLIAGTKLVNLFGHCTKEKTFEEFQLFFNKYLFKHNSENKESGGRFHRLLTNHELDYLLTKIKSENY